MADLLEAAEEREFAAREAFRKHSNADGVIGEADLRALLASTVAEAQDVSEAEFKIFFEEQFGRSDVNADGVLEFKEFVTFYNALIDYHDKLNAERGDGGGAVAKEAEAKMAEESAKRDAEAAAEVEKERAAMAAEEEALRADRAARGMLEGGRWPHWYSLVEDAADREKLLAPFWENPALFKQDDGTVNIMDLLGELGKHLDFCPTIALRVGEDIRKVPEFSDESLAYMDINFSFDTLVRCVGVAGQHEAEAFWNRAAKGELFEHEE